MTSHVRTFTFQPELDTGTNYSNGDRMGSVEGFDIGGGTVERVPAILLSLGVIDTEQQSPSFDLYLFDQDVEGEIGADNDPFEPTATAAGAYLAHISFKNADYTDDGSTASLLSYYSSDLGIGMLPAPSQQKIYCLAVARGSSSWTASDSLKVKMFCRLEEF